MREARGLNTFSFRPHAGEHSLLLGDPQGWDRWSSNRGCGGVLVALKAGGVLRLLGTVPEGQGLSCCACCPRTSALPSAFTLLLPSAFSVVAQARRATSTTLCPLSCSARTLRTASTCASRPRCSTSTTSRRQGPASWLDCSVHLGGATRMVAAAAAAVAAHRPPLPLHTEPSCPRPSLRSVGLCMSPLSNNSLAQLRPLTDPGIFSTPLARRRLGCACLRCPTTACSWTTTATRSPPSSRAASRCRSPQMTRCRRAGLGMFPAAMMGLGLLCTGAPAACRCSAPCIDTPLQAGIECLPLGAC